MRTEHERDEIDQEFLNKAASVLAQSDNEDQLRIIVGFLEEQLLARRLAVARQDDLSLRRWVIDLIVDQLEGIKFSDIDTVLDKAKLLFEWLSENQQPLS